MRAERCFRLRPALQQAQAMVKGVKPASLWPILNVARMLDQSAANPEARQLFYDGIEHPFNEAGGMYGTALQSHAGVFLTQIKKLGAFTVAPAL